MAVPHVCIDCGVPLRWPKAARCKSCAARLGWRSGRYALDRYERKQPETVRTREEVEAALREPKQRLEEQSS